MNQLVYKVKQASKGKSTRFNWNGVVSVELRIYGTELLELRLG